MKMALESSSTNDCEKEVSHESTPLLRPKPANRQDPGRYFVLRVRIISVIVPVFFMSTGDVRESMVSQYLMERLAEEDGFHFNGSEFSPCYSNKSDPRVIEANSVQEKVSQINIYLGVLVSVPSFFSCLLIGSYADYLGRRWLVLVLVFTGVVKLVFVTVFIRLDFDLWLLYLGYGIDGIPGSWFAILLAMYTITADINKYQQGRSFWIYLIDCASAVTAGVTNVGIGYIIDNFGYFWASTALTGMALFALIVSFFCLPETLLNPPREKIWNPLVHMKTICGFYFFDGTVRKRLTFCLCMSLFFFGVMNALNLNGTDVLYQLHEPFCWGASQIGNYKAIKSVCTYFAGVFIMKLLQKIMKDEKIAMFGCFCQAAGLVYEAFIKLTWQFYLVPVIVVPSVFTTSIIRAMMSILAGPSKQGAIFSSIAVMETLCTIASYATFNKVYMATVNYFPGAVYIVMASCSLLAVFLFVVYFYVREEDSPTSELVVENKTACIQNDNDSN